MLTTLNTQYQQQKLRLVEPMILNNLLNIQVMIYSNTLVFLAESLKQVIIFLEQRENGIASPLILSLPNLKIF